ncbi:zinc-alpha-2-glycoprotein-like [Sparus aurata]|uniref:zinc-alpha-2-glycoprotein-like n=1 Tax=Sparus aurata TaxID=8175 RepID=UPI0011C13944|nr:zinc-alpha-2-glycoprotein-like [Sparus aurata]
MGSCDSNKGLHVKDVAKSFIIKYPEQLEWYKQECFSLLPKLKPRTDSLMRLYDQSGGVHVLQKVEGCEWDDETEEVKGFSQFGYDGEDLLEWDPKTFTWIALRPEAVNISMMWYTKKYLRESFKTVLTQMLPELLKMYVEYGRSFLLRTDHVEAV